MTSTKPQKIADMTYVYVAFTGDYDAHEVVGVFDDLETAWAAAMATPEGRTTAEVTRYEMNSTGRPDFYRWREWDWQAKTHVTKESQE